MLLNDSINVLSRLRDTDREYIRDHAAILSPIRCLPPEILGEIFKYCLPMYSKDASNADIRATMLPSHICGYWRTVAIATSMLWSTVNMNVHAKNLESITALVATWFSRTRGYPLSFWLQGRHVQPIIDAILPYCESWQHVDLHLPLSMIDSFAPAQGRLPRLESLKIRPLYYPYSSSTLLIRMFEEAPSLRHLELGYALSTHAIHLPLAQLTSCHLACSIGKCLELLQRLFTLQTLNVILEYSINSIPPAITLELPLLPLLVSLTVTSKSTPAVFFDHLSLPVLRDFRFFEDKSAFTPIPFISLLSRSSCALQNFYLWGPIDGGDLIECLQHMPSLLHLSIRGAISDFRTFVGHLMPHILENRQVACLVPKLQTIEINPANDDFDSQNFANVVESRWKWEDTVEEASDRVERIHKVTILCVDSYHVHSWMVQLESLQDCAEEGLGVYVEATHSGDIHSLLEYPYSLSDSASE